MHDSDQHTEDQWHDHVARLGAIKTSWHHGAISATEKRRRIAEENSIYYGDREYRSPVTGAFIAKASPVRDEIASIIAESTGVPAECARAAIGRRRDACHQAAYAETMTEARQLLDSGRASRSVRT